MPEFEYEFEYEYEYEEEEEEEKEEDDDEESYENHRSYKFLEWNKKLSTLKHQLSLTLNLLEAGESIFNIQKIQKDIILELVS